MGLIPNLEIVRNNTKPLKLSSCLNYHTQKWCWAIEEGEEKLRSPEETDVN